MESSDGLWRLRRSNGIVKSRTQDSTRESGVEKLRTGLLDTRRGNLLWDYSSLNGQCSVLLPSVTGSVPQRYLNWDTVTWQTVPYIMIIITCHPAYRFRFSFNWVPPSTLVTRVAISVPQCFSLPLHLDFGLLLLQISILNSMRYCDIKLAQGFQGNLDLAI